MKPGPLGRLRRLRTALTRLVELSLSFGDGYVLGLGERGQLQRALTATLIGACRGARRRPGKGSTVASWDMEMRSRGGSHAGLYDINNGDTVEF